MKWEKLAQRELDFLKNCLVFEAFTDNFIKVFGFYYPPYLTIRKGMSYTHYHNKESSFKMAKFILKKINQNPNFMKKLYKDGKKKFDNLIDYCKGLRDLENKDNIELLKIIKKYFVMYKEPYPYFLITIEARLFENDKRIEVKEAIEIMGRLRLYGRASFNKTHEIVHPLFDEIAKRFNISVYELKFLTPNEIIKLLKEERLDINQLVKDRQKCFFIHIDGKFMLHEDATLKLHYDDVKGITEIKGQGTFSAKYKGKVRIIKSNNDLKKLKKGEIIVTQMTTTDLITENLKKAGAIITDEGGITCHAAIVSREFKIPALIGTRIATKVLKNGDFVEVDATKGIIKKIKKK